MQDSPGLIRWMRRVAWNTPVRMVGTVCSDVAERATAHVALTQATVDPEHRAEFDHASIELLNRLPGVPGLLMYSIRREFLGEKAWTMADDQGSAGVCQLVLA